MKCDGCEFFLREEEAKLVTYDILGIIWQFSFCDSECQSAFEIKSDLSQEEIDSANDTQGELDGCR